MQSNEKPKCAQCKKDNAGGTIPGTGLCFCSQVCADIWFQDSPCAAPLLKMSATRDSIGHKQDKGKSRLGLLWREPLGPALAAVADILAYGIDKYQVEAGNWMKVERAEERYTDALLRHIVASIGGEHLDPESKLPHMAHAACNALFVLAMQLRARRGWSAPSPYSEMK